MTETKKRFRLNLPILSVIVTLALVLAMVIYWMLAVRPWLAAPDKDIEEIERLWAPVAEAVTVSAAAAAGEQERLTEALARLADWPRQDLDDAVTAWQKSERPTDGQLVTLRQTEAALQRLLDWSRREGGLGAQDPCALDEALDPMGLLLLGRVALVRLDFVAQGLARDEVYFAVARLAHAMRTGGGPLHFIAGIRLTDDLLVSARRAKMLHLLREHGEWQPDEDEVWRAINAEAFCADKLLDRHFAEIGKGWPLRSPAARGAPQAWFRPDAAFLQRERLMVRLWWGERLQRAEPVRREPDKLAEVLRVDIDALPRSLLVRVIAADLAEPMKGALESIAAFHAALREPQ